MTRTRTSVLLTALLVVGALTTGMAATATTNQTQNGSPAEAAVDSGETFWQGQSLRLTAGEANASETWSLRRVGNGEIGSVATEVLLNGSGSAVVSTDDLEGRFVVVDENGEPVVFENGVAQGVGNVSEASFGVTTQQLDAAFEDSVVRGDDSQDARTDLRIQSNRAGYHFYLVSEQLSAQQLADVVSAAEVRNGRAVVTRNVSSDAVFDANFTGVEPGTYNITVLTTDGAASETVTMTVSESVEGSAALENATVVEQRGDVARFNVTFNGTDRATVAIGSREVGFLARFTVVDANGDGVATVAVNSFRAGVSPDTPGVSVVGEDRLTDFRLVTDPIPGRLDAATYPIQVFVGATKTAVGSLTLEERATQAIQVWTAPDGEAVTSVARLTEIATQDRDVAYQDWVIVQVQASGLYGYVQNISDLDSNQTGLSMTLTRLGEINRPSVQVPLEQAKLLVDESGNQFFLAIDSNVLERGATYRANFTVSAENPYVAAGNATSLVTNFTVVERSVSFDQPIRAPSASDATISGDSTLAPGTELTVEVTNTGDNPFLKRQTVTVTEAGTWQATFDLSDVPADTNFTVSIPELAANATGTIVSVDAAEVNTTTPAETTTPANETTTTGENGTTTTEENETTTTEENETTTTGENGTATAQANATETGTPTTTEGTVAGAGQAEQTTTATETETETETTTEAEKTTVGVTVITTTEADAGSVPAPGFGALAVLFALAVVLAGGALAVRHR